MGAQGTLPVRDGTALAFTAWHADGRMPLPAIVIRTPYGKERFAEEPWSRLVEAGYHLVAVDVRGRGESQGVWRPWVNDGYDGFDVIEWVAQQSWCDGNVATLGGSYDAMTQWWTAVTQPPHLRCMVAMAVSPQREQCGSYGRSNGVVMPYWLWWLRWLDVLAPGEARIDWPAVMASPERQMAKVAGVADRHWQDYLDGSIGYGEQEWGIDAHDVTVPTLVTSGLWDDPKTFQWWQQLQESPCAADHQFLVGPWDHAGNARPRPVLGGVDVSDVLIDQVDHWLAFLDTWMRRTLAPRRTPRVSICRSGTWQWETATDWPESQAVNACQLPDGSWTHNPNSPLWLNGAEDDLAFADAPLDPRELDSHPDVLTLDVPSSLLTGRASGEPQLTLVVTQERPGTIVAWLSDIAPDGSGLRLGLWPTAIQHPGGTVTLDLRLAAIHHELRAGHHYRVSLSSSFAPIYAHAREEDNVTVHQAILRL